MSLELPQLLGRQFARRTTGVLTATRGKLRRLFCIEHGQLIFAASNLIEEQLAESIVGLGHLTRRDLEAAKKQAAAASGFSSPALSPFTTANRTHTGTGTPSTNIEYATTSAVCSKCSCSPGLS